MSQRQERVAERIKQEVSQIVHDEIKDPRVGFVTITDVELTNDLRFARIFFSVLGDEKKKSDAAEGLASALKYIKRLLGERIKLRYATDIAFVLDESSEKSVRLAQIFDQIAEERKHKDEEGNPL